MSKIRSFYESARSIVQFTMTYSATDWSDSTKLGKPVKKTELFATPAVFFSLRPLTGGANDLDYTDSDTTKIEWIDEDAGIINIKFGGDTEGMVGKKNYELRVKLLNGSWITVDTGELEILESLVDTP